MEQLITDIQRILEDYRAGEKRDVQVTTEGITIWIKQFERDVRLTILTELKHILKSRYFSKSRAQTQLAKLIEVLTRDFNYNSEKEFLEHAVFLDLQDIGKSQKAMLELLESIIQEKYGMQLKDCGSKSKRFSVYIDDVLCSGLTLKQNIESWSKKEFQAGKTNQVAVEDGSTELILMYFFLHEKNWRKKKSEFKRNLSKNFSDNINVYRVVEISNQVEDASPLDLLYPVEDNQPQIVIDYKDMVVKHVDEYTEKNHYVSPEEFYRPSDRPKKESLFTSPENRIIVENEFLRKGVEILNSSNANNKQIRALGYSLPSQKNFGFGALCFTWRNIPNNTPLVFWYLGGGFTPFFKKKSGPNIEDIFKFLV
jgi:hypothetical protein